MVSWGWIPISLLIGVVIGVFLTCLAAANDFAEDQQRKWEDE